MQNVFLAFYVTDVFLKLSGMGVRRYYKDSWNRFDFGITMSSLLGQILAAFSQSSAIFIFLRPFRLMRLLKARRVYQELMLAAAQILPRVASRGAALAVVFYPFR
jgi:hypothetical protein